MKENRSFSSVKYRKLHKKTDDSYIDEQFSHETPKIPWKAICLAAMLFLGGIFLLITGILIVTGHLDTKYGDRTWPIFILGVLTFLPGAYHIRIAYYAYRGYHGFSFDEIPEFE
ncbi:transmembrane protein 230-like [Rhodnius prolixus]|uniref:Transmembrane protein 230 n=2 Tax=Rhodnius TaxID=13248 RepID=T1HHR5_RHOPR